MLIVAFGELQVTGCICLRQVTGYFSCVVDCIPAPPLFIEEVARSAGGVSLNFELKIALANVWNLKSRHGVILFITMVNFGAIPYEFRFTSV